MSTLLKVAVGSGARSERHIPALDLVRGLAAVAVAIGHFFIYGNVQVTAVEPVPILAVEVFFVLSGFVLAPQIAYCVAELRARTLGVFLIRRWMRTVPPYLIALLCMSALYGEVGSPDFFRYAFYVQNLVNLANILDYYTIAWSLSVEEWFYLTFPALCMIAALIARRAIVDPKRRARIAVVLTALAFVAICAGLRFFASPAEAAAVGGVRRVVIYRLDSIAVGVLLFFFCQGRTFKARYCVPLFTATAVSAYFLSTRAATGLGAELVYPFIASAFGVTALMAAQSINNTLQPSFSRAAAWLAHISYSLYLFHLIILTILTPILKPAPVATQFTIYILLCLTFSTLFYSLIEEPILARRPLFGEKPPSERQTRLSMPLALKLTIVAGSLALSLALAEGGIRLLKATVRSNELVGLQTHADVLRSVGSYWEASDVLGFALKPDFVATDESQDPNISHVTIHINHLGLRGRNISLTKPPGVKRILNLGGSFTFGLFVEDEQSYPAVLEHLLNAHGDHVQVLNAGYADGWCPDEMAAWLLSKGFNFSPDLVIMDIWVGDALDCSGKDGPENADGIPLSVKRPGLYVDDFGRLRFNANLPGDELVYRIPIINELYLAALGQRIATASELLFKRPTLSYRTQSNGRDSAEFPYPFVTSPRITDQMRASTGTFWHLVDGVKKATDARGIKLMVTLIPMNFQVHKDLLPVKLPPAIYGHQEVRRNYFDLMRPQLEARRIPYIDILAAMKKAKGQRFFPMSGDVHMNIAGNAYAAAAVLPGVETLLDFPSKGSVSERKKLTSEMENGEANEKE